jgi:parallel beta-helix repeat protein
MKRKCLAVGIILLFIGTVIVPTIAQDAEKSPLPASRGNWLYVGGTGPGNYTRIRDAVNNANDGDTVFVYDDSSPYIEWLTINRSINLIGEARNTTVIRGTPDGQYLIHIIAPHVVVREFSLLNNQGDGILIESDNVTITGTIISGMRSAAIGITDADHINISSNVLTDSVSGVYVVGSCGYNIISHNVIRYHVDSGIYISGKYNIIYGNDIAPADSTIDGMYEFGIFLHEGAFNNISYNTVSSLKDGIRVEYSYKNILYRNNLTGNQRFGVILIDASGDRILENNFMNNTKNARIIFWLLGAISMYHKLSFPLLPLPTQWARNFWDRPRLMPYPIAEHLMFGLIIPGYLNIFFPNFFESVVNFVWFDLHPAQEPYDILGMR